MAELKFANVPGSWSGNDYPKVTMTKVSVESGAVQLFIFMTHMGIDYDGMGNAYGPADKCPMDSLHNAGWKDDNGYYGVKAYNPKTVPAGVVLATPHDYYKDVFGKVPAVKQNDPYKGFFISVTSGGVDASLEAFGVLHGSFAAQGVLDGNAGIVLRPDTGQTAAYTYLAGEGGDLKNKKGQYKVDHRLGECSYKVFLDLGGQPKQCADRYANNNFPTTFLVFPGSTCSSLIYLSLEDEPNDLPAFLAFQAIADKKAKGTSALAAFNKYVADGRQNKPEGFWKIAYALQGRGYLTSSPVPMDVMA